MELTTSYDDIWFEIGKDGERIPMYFSRLEEEAAIAAFLSGDWGSLMADEIEFMRSAAEDCGLCAWQSNNPNNQTIEQ